MKESINTALILNLVIVFLFIFVILFAGSTAYTKAFKVKNRIISIIEKRETTVLTKGFKAGEYSIIDEIEDALGSGQLGYRIERNISSKCQDAMKSRFKNTNYSYNVVDTGLSTYNYCIAEFLDESSAMKGRYYAVITYMYFEIPIIGRTLEFPVYGETKTIGVAY